MNQITQNGITISYPAGYKSFSDYVSTLHINLKIAEKARPDLVKGYEQAIAQAEKLLA